MIRRFIPVCALVGASLVTANPAQATIAPDTHCRSGKVSITFDDGPQRTNTPKLLKVLRKNHAQATFFVEGRYAKRYPRLLREMIRDGHAVGNHTWDHPELTRLSDKKIAAQISRTTKVITKATGVKPTLIRPPYGATDARVRRVIKKQHLTQELWTIDTNDWRGGSTKSITKVALRDLRKHKANVILMHDAVPNSPRTVKAVPAIIRGLRKKGYCLVPLQVTAKYSHLSAPPVSADEGAGEPTAVTVRFKLSSPSQRDASFRWHTVSGTAVAGTDFQSTGGLVAIRRGASMGIAHVKLFADPMPNTAKGFRIVLEKPRKLSLSTVSVPITITDNDDWESSIGELISPQ